MTKSKKTIYIVCELHNHVEPRLTGIAYANRRFAEKRVKELNNREDIHDYYIRELELIE